MRSDALARRAEELAAQGAAFATATVVRAQRPTSAHAGDVALITSDGNIEGFVGGICAEHSVRLFAWTAMKSGKPLLLRVLPEVSDDMKTGIEEDGAVTVENTCLSGGAIEIFLEPTLPTPRVNIVGSKPIAAAIERLGSEFDLDVAAVGDNAPELREGDLGIVVAAHGKGELEAIRAGLEAGLPYVGLVASPKRGAALIEELRADGVADDQLARVEYPAGIDIGAKTPPEVALTILARLIETRYGGAYTPPLRSPSAEGAAELRGRPDLRDDRHDGARHPASRARRRDRVVLPRGLQDRVRSATRGRAANRRREGRGRRAGDRGRPDLRDDRPRDARHPTSRARRRDRLLLL